MLKLPRIKSLAEIAREADKLIWGEIRGEKKRVPSSVKTIVYERAKEKCEYPTCKTRLKKSEGQFHHWRDPPNERTTAFLCYKCHKKHGHETKTVTDAFGNKTVRIVRKRIPISKKKKTSKRQPKKKGTKRRRPKTQLERLTKQLEKDF